MWWDTARIETTITRQFVCEHLSSGNVPRLDEQLGFGDGLTDGTYWEWISDKAKRIFLILHDLGIQDQIFSIIDSSWDDNDLPLALDQVQRLVLTQTKDEKLHKRFYSRQFHYLVRYLGYGDHVEYQDDAVVPVCVVDRRPGLSINSFIDRVELPNNPGEILSRRRIPLETGPGSISIESLQHEINKTKHVQNEHVVSYYGSYIFQGSSYILFTQPSDYSLKSLLTSPPATLKALPKNDRRLLVMNWVHCLIDTLCYLHNRGCSHGSIKPSTILFNKDNNICYNGISRLSRETLPNTPDKTAFDKESYDYAAPEQWYRPSASHAVAHRKSTLPSSASTTSSSDNATFTISRGGGDGGPVLSALQTPNPHLDPQAADIFSLGCVILELLNLLMKRQTRAFATHRAAKHKLAGRGGAVLDSSFHKNLGQVESWMASLAKDAAKKDDQVFRGIAPMLQVVARMLAVAPQERPTAIEVEQLIYRILREHCLLEEPHCVHQYDDWSFGTVSPLRSAMSTSPRGDDSLSSSSFNIATRRRSRTSTISRPGSRLSFHRARGSSLHDRDEPGSPAGLQTIPSTTSTPLNRVRAWQAPVFAGT